MMKHNESGIGKRICADAVLFLSCMLFPWWLVLPLAVFFAFSFDGYYEVVLAGGLLDILFSAPSNMFGNFQFFFLAGFSVLFFLIFLLKKQILLKQS